MSFVLQPGETPNSIERARKIADLLMQQGTSYEPVQHWTQALARVAQAGSGAMMRNYARDEELKGKKSVAEALMSASTPEAKAQALIGNPFGFDAGMGMLKSMEGKRFENQLPPTQLQRENLDLERKTKLGQLGISQQQLAIQQQKAPLERQMLEQSLKKGQPGALIEERMAALQAAGIDPKSPEGRRYLVMGDLGKQEKSPETEFDKVIAKGAGKDLEDRTSELKSSEARLQRLQQLERIVSNPNVYQGKGANAVLEAKKLAAALGINVQGVPDAEAMRAIANQMALSLRNTASGEGMPGALSDKDREFLVQSVPGLTNTPQGNMALIRMMRERETFIRTMNSEAIRYIKANKSNVGLGEHMTAWMQKNPMFSDDTIRASGFDPKAFEQQPGQPRRVTIPAKGVPDAAAPQKPRARNAQTGQEVEFDGEKWVPVR